MEPERFSEIDIASLKALADWCERAADGRCCKSCDQSWVHRANLLNRVAAALAAHEPNENKLRAALRWYAGEIDLDGNAWHSDKQVPSIPNIIFDQGRLAQAALAAHEPMSESKLRDRITSYLANNDSLTAEQLSDLLRDCRKALAAHESPYSQ